LEESGDKMVDLNTEDMALGGEGHKVFYDQILTRYARKYGKKWGATVEDVVISTDLNPNPTRVAETLVALQDDFNDSWYLEWTDEEGMSRTLNLAGVMASYPTEADAVAAAQEFVKHSVSTVHSILITDEMSNAVTKGQYLFHTRGDWQSEFLYGTSVSGEVFQSYVNEAKVYDTLAEFTDAMQAKYGDLYLGDMDEATAGEFYDAVFRVAERQKRPAAEPGVEIEEPKDLPDVDEYDPQVKHDVAAKMEDGDLADRIANGTLTEDEIMELVQQIGEEEADARAAGEDINAAAQVSQADLSTGEQQILSLGDEAQSALERLEAMPPDSPRREMAEARARALLDQF
ncbi:unnamed protein product, partial [marine sediment metagenome]